MPVKYGENPRFPGTRRRISPGWGVKIKPLKTLPVPELHTKRQAMRAFVELLKREPGAWEYIDVR